MENRIKEDDRIIVNMVTVGTQKQKPKQSTLFYAKFKRQRPRLYSFRKYNKKYSTIVKILSNN